MGWGLWGQTYSLNLISGLFENEIKVLDSKNITVTTCFMREVAASYLLSMILWLKPNLHLIARTIWYMDIINIYSRPTWNQFFYIRFWFFMLVLGLFFYYLVTSLLNPSDVWISPDSLFGKTELPAFLFSFYFFF